jgi:hypothetical protein
VAAGLDFLVDRKRDFAHPYCTLASALGHLRETETAATALEQCLRLNPNFIANRPALEWYRNPSDKPHILALPSAVALKLWTE